MVIDLKPVTVSAIVNIFISSLFLHSALLMIQKLGF